MRTVDSLGLYCLTGKMAPVLLVFTRVTSTFRSVLTPDVRSY